ncbi:hypothetical protein HPB47_012532 [Ixodes persulcatus]|uniref:Uncharacterized protein n=1 Tax=Ixodes persulcatus TaxID=34615 RepID=A0AC60NTB2_IXOPE|nr:hypothetical protein HPB47_012532 [Ixodes persulcatus]
MAEVASGQKKAVVAEKFGISPSSLLTILKSKDAIEKGSCIGDIGQAKETDTVDARRPQQGYVHMVCGTRAKKIPISGSVVQQEANFACLLGIDNFKARTGWLNRFKAHHDIVGKTLSGESDTKLDLYIVLQMMTAAWTATKHSVIANCFTHAGFKLGDPDADSAEDNEALPRGKDAIEDTIKAWLCHAPERMAGKKRENRREVDQADGMLLARL